MSEQPNSIWKKSIRLPQLFLVWLLLMATTMLIIIGIMMVIHPLIIEPQGVAGVLIFGAAGATILLAGWIFIRWLFFRRNLKRSLFALACFAMLIALFYAEEDWRGWHAWNQFKLEWEAKGEKFELASIVPPAVPDEQNFAMAPILVESVKATLGPKRSREWFGDKNAENGRTNFTDRLMLNIQRNNDWTGFPTNGQWPKGTLTDLAVWQAYYRAPVDANRNSTATTNEFLIAAQMQTPAQDVLLALSKYDLAIEELRQASQLPYARFPLGYDDENPAEILLPHLALLKRSSQALQLRAIAELQNRESEKALADVKLSLRLADAMRTEPFLISHLFRAAILSLTLQPVYEGLAEHKWSEAQLVDLDAELAKSDYLVSYKLAMRGEMVFQGGILDYLRHHPDQLLNLSGDFASAKPPLPGRIVCGLIPTGWFYQNQLRCARPMVEFYLPAADVKQATISPAKIRDAGAAIEADTKRPTPNNIIERMLMPALGASARKFAYAQASVDLARTAIALERYHLAHGEFPESLAALAPQYIAQVPHDVIGGHPLKYRREADGDFVLYSVGWNETDDGGMVVFKKGETPSMDISQGDWVWRYPAR